ncbi:MAG: double-strand break repair protein AddB, partial [Pseudomonadota bacterium]
MSGASSNVFSIPPGAPFLPTLVGALLDGQLLDGFRPSDDPLTLASTTIWVPTRRAARVLVRAFSDSLSPQGILLPAIRTFGDADDASARLELDPDPQPTMEPLERQILLSRMIDAWSGTMNATAKTLYEGRDVLVPSSQSDALWFAADLARLMDTVATEEVDWSTLLDLSPPDHGAWWELTTEFLKIATQTWPAVLAERGASDPAHLRVNQLRAQAALYRTDGAQGPVIAAGSTGSIPATADLLRAIRSLPNGAVILPGLDRDLDEETWAKIDLPDAGGDDSSAAQGHPQFGLKRLLSALDVAHGEVVHLGSINDRNVGFKRIREAFISEAMRPAHASHRWLDRVSAFDEEQRRRAFDKASLIVAANEREEAAAIAVALRDALETDNATAALITPDRTLARRVAVELARFGVPADDSAGLPLANQSQTHLFRLVAQIAFEPPHAVTLASLLQSPHVRFGLSADQAKRAGQILELAVLRGALTPPRPADLPIALAEARGNMLEERDKQTRQRTTGSMAPRRLPAVITTYSNDDWRAAAHVAQTLADAFAGAFRDLANTPSADFATLTLALRAVFEQMCTDDAGLRAVTSEEPAGQHLETTLAALVSGGHHLTIPPQDYHACFDALIASETVRVPSRGTPRISILGPIEARLQTFDRVVLGGLTDGVWPAGAAGDPFLSRPMKSQIGLPAPERRIGLAAHDFQMLAGVEDVVFSRSERRGDAPVLPS